MEGAQIWPRSSVRSSDGGRSASTPQGCLLLKDTGAGSLWPCLAFSCLCTPALPPAGLSQLKLAASTGRAEGSQAERRASTSTLGDLVPPKTWRLISARAECEPKAGLFPVGADKALPPSGELCSRGILTNCGAWSPQAGLNRRSVAFRRLLGAAGAFWRHFRGKAAQSAWRLKLELCDSPAPGCPSSASGHLQRFPGSCPVARCGVKFWQLAISGCCCCRVRLSTAKLAATAWLEQVQPSVPGRLQSFHSGLTAPRLFERREVAHSVARCGDNLSSLRLAGWAPELTYCRSCSQKCFWLTTARGAGTGTA